MMKYIQLLEQEAGHIIVSVGLMLVGVGLVVYGLDYGKEVFSIAAGWAGRSMLGKNGQPSQTLPSST